MGPAAAPPAATSYVHSIPRMSSHAELELFMGWLHVEDPTASASASASAFGTAGAWPGATVRSLRTVPEVLSLTRAPTHEESVAVCSFLDVEKRQIGLRNISIFLIEQLHYNLNDSITVTETLLLPCIRVIELALIQKAVSVEAYFNQQTLPMRIAIELYLSMDEMPEHLKFAAAHIVAKFFPAAMMRRPLSAFVLDTSWRDRVPTNVRQSVISHISNMLQTVQPRNLSADDFNMLVQQYEFGLIVTARKVHEYADLSTLCYRMAFLMCDFTNHKLSIGLPC
jgi:hypothetical protein